MNIEQRQGEYKVIGTTEILPLTIMNHSIHMGDND